MIRFVLNDRLIETDLPEGTTLLDFIRYEQRLTGTKIGCREGDCGACTALIGELAGDSVSYRNITSCISPLGSAHGKHVVTVEGLNMSSLSPVQQAMVDHSGTQCGFCTPGFVVSLSGFCLSKEEVNYDNAISAIDGNICRCTGYKSIQRAAHQIVEQLVSRDTNRPVEWAADNGFVPAYFKGIGDKLRGISPRITVGNAVVGGGTDLYVQRHDDLHHAQIRFVSEMPELKGIRVENNQVVIGASSTVSDVLASPEMNRYFPDLRRHLKLVSSTPIRNMGTLAGNFVNASPIGDLTAVFIALDSSIVLKSERGERTIKLRDLYKGYKVLDKTPDEHVVRILFDAPDNQTRFNFEKVSKRTYLDIASVNSAMRIRTEGSVISDIHISAGGVGPTPFYLARACAFLRGKSLTPESVAAAVEEAQAEISPISDVRGSEQYKRLLLRQLIFAHFIELFPETFKLEVWI